MRDKGDITPEDNVLGEFNSKKRCRKVARKFIRRICETLKEEYEDDLRRGNGKLYLDRKETGNKENNIIKYDITGRTYHELVTFCTMYFIIH